MSANNYLEITRVGKVYTIRDLCADTCEGSEVKRTTSLKKAILWAEEYQEEFPAEYGIHFSNI